MAKYRKQPTALGRGDVALVAVDDPLNLFAASAHKEPVALGLQARGEHRRVDKIGDRMVSMRIHHDH